MFTALFAMGRLPGWIAQWKEMIEDPETKIARPRQVYTGRCREYVPIESRQALETADRALHRPRPLARGPEPGRGVRRLPGRGRTSRVMVDIGPGTVAQLLRLCNPWSWMRW